MFALRKSSLRPLVRLHSSLGQSSAANILLDHTPSPSIPKSSPTEGDTILDQTRAELHKIANGSNRDTSNARELTKKLHTALKKQGTEADDVLDEHLAYTSKLLLSKKNAHSIQAVLSDRVAGVLSDPALTKQEKLDTTLGILRLTRNIVGESTKIALHHAVLKELAKLTRDRDLGASFQLFETLLQIKMDVTNHILAPIRYDLRTGSDADIRLYEWSHMFEEEDPVRQRELLVQFITSYDMKMIRPIVLRHIKAGDYAMASRYMELYIGRYTLEIKSLSNPAQITDKNMKLYEIVCYFSARAWNPRAVLDVLAVMKQNKVPISKNLYMMLLNAMRNKKQSDAALSLIRKLPKYFPKPDSQFKMIINNELIKFVSESFSTDARISMGHFLAAYPTHLELVNRLGLLGVIYLGRTERMSNAKHRVSFANLDTYFSTEDDPSHYTITTLYSFVMRHIIRHNLTTVSLTELLTLYIREAKRYDFKGPFRDDGVLLDLFVKTAVQMKKPALALHILERYMKELQPRKWNKSLVTYIFFHHGCASGSAAFERMTALMAVHEVKPDFNLLAGMVKKDSKNSERWYKRIKELGYHVQLSSLRARAMKGNWDVDDEAQAAAQMNEDMHAQQYWEDEVEIWNEEETSNDFVELLEDGIEGLEMKS